MNKILIQGFYDEAPCVYVDHQLLRPEYSLAVRRHSPDGFSWGYLGSGCAQLALAILLEVTGRTMALRYYQEFKEGFIAGLPQGKNFEIELDVEAWLKTREG
jgi:hypothetical protein